MRRRLALVSIAVTVLVAVAFLVPLALLVRNQATDRALLRAERDAQAMAAALVVVPATSNTEVTPDVARVLLDSFVAQAATTVVFPDGTQVGAPYEETSSLEQARRGAAFTAQLDGGDVEVLVPVVSRRDPLGGESTIVVRTVVAREQLTSGVAVAWALLGLLAVFLVTVATLAADRLARSIVRPVAALSDAARSLGAGNLDTRVEPDGTREIAEVGEAFNFLAGRLGALLSAERESVADLSHRLRTPLTALRLQAETLGDRSEAASLVADIDRLERAVDRMIEEARRPSSEPSSESRVTDLAAMVRHRAGFWEVLADEQNRGSLVRTSGGELLVGLSDDELGAVIDTLLENVFAYTAPGTGYTVTAGPAGGDEVSMVIEDDGPGFPDAAVVERGTSGGGSTGLGLDIVRRTAQRAGGRMHITNRRGGGAHVEVVFARVRRTAGEQVSVQQVQGP